MDPGGDVFLYIGAPMARVGGFAPYMYILSLLLLFIFLFLFIGFFLFKTIGFFLPTNGFPEREGIDSRPVFFL